MQRKLDEIRSLQEEIKNLRSKLAGNQGGDLAASAVDGVVVARVDGLAPTDLRELAVVVRNQPDVDVVVLIGATDTGGVALAAAVTPGTTVAASSLIKEAAQAVGGGGGGKGDIATAGGKDRSRIDEALAIATDAVRAARS